MALMQAGQGFVGVRKMKNGKWRLYTVVSQAISCWRGENNKITVIRNDYENILNFDSRDEAVAYAKDHLDEQAMDF